MKKYLVGDSYFDENRKYNFQYIIVKEYEDGLKVACDYQNMKVDNSQECYEIILKLMIKNDIDKLMISGMGINIGIIDKLKQNLNLYNNTIICYGSTRDNHDRISAYLNDLKNNKLAISSFTCDLNNFINTNKIIASIHTSDLGLFKIDKLVDDENRDKLHLILTLYGCLLKIKENI